MVFNERRNTNLTYAGPDALQIVNTFAPIGLSLHTSIRAWQESFVRSLLYIELVIHQNAVPHQSRIAISAGADSYGVNVVAAIPHLYEATRFIPSPPVTYRKKALASTR